MRSSNAKRSFCLGGRHWKAARAQFVEAQGGCCAICGRTFAESELRPCLDHDHETGMIRGALCMSCNVKLGWYESKRETIDRYLRTAAAHRPR